LVNSNDNKFSQKVRNLIAHRTFERYGHAEYKRTRTGNNIQITNECCTFDFEDFYGAEVGKVFIEIHHTKPIFQYEDSDTEKTVENALKNLIPACSNCHRMVHRNWSKPLEIQYLIGRIEQNGIYR